MKIGLFTDAYYSPINGIATSVLYITCSFAFYIDDFLNKNLVLDRRV